MGIDLNNGYRDLLQHYGHDVKISVYAHPDDPDQTPRNVAIECFTCDEVLLDFDKPEEE